MRTLRANLLPFSTNTLAIDPYFLQILILAVSIIIIMLVLVKPMAALAAWLGKHSRVIFNKVFAREIQRYEAMKFNPNRVLRTLLSAHPQKISYWDIHEVRAECIPNEKEVWGDGYHSFFWFWVLSLIAPVREPRSFPYAFVAGFYDPGRYEARTRLRIWLFPTRAEAARCPLKEMKSDRVSKVCPGQPLSDFMMKQLRDGLIARQ